MCSRYLNGVILGHVFEMGSPWGEGKGNGEERGGRSVYSQPGIRVDRNRTTAQRRDSKKARREFRNRGRDFQAKGGYQKDWAVHL
jgi:hypothetical protein